MIDEKDICECGHLFVNHHDGHGVWGKGCNQSLAMELQCPCQKTGATMTKHDNRDAAVEAMVDDELHTGDETTTAERLTNLVIQYAAEQVAAERTRIGDDLMELYTNAESMTEFGEEAHAYLHRLRGADTESDKGGK